MALGKWTTMSNDEYAADEDLAAKVEQLWDEWVDIDYGEDGFFGGILADFLEQNYDELVHYNPDSSVRYHLDRTIDRLRDQQKTRNGT